MSPFQCITQRLIANSIKIFCSEFETLFARMIEILSILYCIHENMLHPNLLLALQYLFIIFSVKIFIYTLTVIIRQ